MILPTEAERATLRAYALAKFGATRLLLMQLTAPIDAALVLAPFDPASFSTYRDLRFGSARTAHATAVTQRGIWCSPLSPAGDAPLEPTIDTLASTQEDPNPVRRVALARSRALMERWPAVDGKAAIELDKAAGWWGQLAVAAPLDASAPPPGLSSSDASRLLAGAPASGPGALWAVTCADKPELSLVLAAPLPNVWHAGRGAVGKAQGEGTGFIDAILAYLRPAVVWCIGGGLDAMLAEHPGFADRMQASLLDVGGAGADASASFL